MKKIGIAVFVVVALAGCSDSHNNGGQTPLDAGMDQSTSGGEDAGSPDASSNNGSDDAGPTDGGANDGGAEDAGADDAGVDDAGPDDRQDGGSTRDAGNDMAGDAATADMTGDTGAADMSGADAGGGDMSDPGEYDTTGWPMEQVTISDSASVGTPDSYFFDVDSGSPLSASITGGGNGTWSVNVFGGMSNQLYCTGTTLCQVMLRPEDTVVVVTAITTDIGSYSLTVDYAGDGLR